MPDYQSAYRKDAGCESVLIKLLDSALWAMENQECLAVILLDLSAAFDTVDHDLLLQVLENTFGLADTTLAWFDSYLRPRDFRVLINKSSSTPKQLTFSVPQGSAGGANFFTAYCHSLPTAIPRSITSQGFADDHFMHRRFKPGSASNTKLVINSLSNTVLNVKSWMDSMRLKMNPDKTEFMLFGSTHQLKKVAVPSINLLDQTIEVTDYVRCLGAHLDASLTLSQHITIKAQAAMLNIKRIRSVRKYLTPEACEILVNGLVLSHLDYANSILVGLPLR